MKTEFVALTFIKSCTGFKSAIRSQLPDYHPTTFEKGVKGCTGIFRDEDRGYDVYGENGQHFWVSDANVIWGRKAVNPEDGTPVAPKPEPVQENSLAPVVKPEEEPSLLQRISVEEIPVPEKTKLARPKGKGKR